MIFEKKSDLTRYGTNIFNRAMEEIFENFEILGVETASKPPTGEDDSLEISAFTHGRI